MSFNLDEFEGACNRGVKEQDLKLLLARLEALDGKHDLQKPVNMLIQRKLADIGLFGVPARQPQAETPAATHPQGEKPVMLVVLERFTQSDAIYHRHSLAMRRARALYKVVAIGFEDCTDKEARQLFDEFVPLDRSLSLIDQLRFIKADAVLRQAEICYLPKVGVFPLTMCLANLRVAPLQMMAVGHPTTPHSDAIDDVTVEDDFAGEAVGFINKLAAR